MCLHKKEQGQYSMAAFLDRAFHEHSVFRLNSILTNSLDLKYIHGSNLCCPILEAMELEQKTGTKRRH